MMLLLALLVAQDKTDAAELLKKVEDKAAAAKTLRWKGTAKVGADKREITLALDAAFKEGNRARLSADSKEISFTFLCDGKTNAFISSKKGDAGTDADPGFAAALNRILVRGGLFTINHLRPDAAAAKMLDSVKVSGVTAADDKIGDRAVKVISYTVTVDEKDAAVKLWVDAKTLALIKRELTAQEPVITETFDEWTVDGEIADDLFKAPEKKESGK